MIKINRKRIERNLLALELATNYIKNIYNYKSFRATPKGLKKSILGYMIKKFLEKIGNSGERVHITENDDSFKESILTSQDNQMIALSSSRIFNIIFNNMYNIKIRNWYVEKNCPRVMFKVDSRISINYFQETGIARSIKFLTTVQVYTRTKPFMLNRKFGEIRVVDTSSIIFSPAYNCTEYPFENEYTTVQTRLSKVINGLIYHYQHELEEANVNFDKCKLIIIHRHKNED